MSEKQPADQPQKPQGKPQRQRNTADEGPEPERPAARGEFHGDEASSTGPDASPSAQGPGTDQPADDE